MSKQRRVVWFSCGAASAVAAFITLDKDPSSHLVYCDTSKNEHPDNRRFLSDVEKWLGKKVEVIHGDYQTVEEVFAKGYMSGVAGARCTIEMKKVPRFHYQRADDIHIFGFTSDERHRVERFTQANPELNLEWPLIEAGCTKKVCFALLKRVGIELPTMYKLGYKNNNCIGCVKAQSPAYWNKIRKDFPSIFRKRAEQSREIGCKLVSVKGRRIFLDRLPNTLTGEDLESITCGPECATTEK